MWTILCKDLGWGESVRYWKFPQGEKRQEAAGFRDSLPVCLCFVSQIRFLHMGERMVQQPQFLPSFATSNSLRFAPCDPKFQIPEKYSESSKHLSLAQSTRTSHSNDKVRVKEKTFPRRVFWADRTIVLMNSNGWWQDGGLGSWIQSIFWILGKSQL